MRGFRYDVITTGLPVRGRPIRLKGAEAEFVRSELEDNVAQGLYSRGMSPWGSWAFPTEEAVGGRRRREEFCERFRSAPRAAAQPTGPSMGLSLIHI